MADINKLRTARRNMKGQLSRTLQALESLTEREASDLGMIKTYLAKAERQFAEVEQRHTELIEIIGDNDFDTEEAWMADCQAKYVAVLISARQVVDRETLSTQANTLPSDSTPMTPQPDARAVPQQPVSTGNLPLPLQAPSLTPQAIRTPSASYHSPSAAPRMARMKFPTFSGDIKDYRRFKELFILCTRDLSEVECFYQLTESMVNARDRNHIKGCIDVERAWMVLDERYGDDDRMVDSLLKDLDNLRPYDNKGKVNLSAMARFVRILQNFETQAETLGLSGELNSKIMLGRVRQHLPEEHRIAYYKSVRDDHTEDSLSGMVKWLYSLQLLLEKARPAGQDTDPPPMPHKPSKSLNAAFSSSKHNSKEGASHIPKCPIHPNTSSHFLKTCNKFRSLTLKEKYDVMKKNSICFRCGHNNCTAGKPPHDRNNCQFKMPCRVQTCGSDEHFPAICPKFHAGVNDQNQSDNMVPIQSNSAVRAPAVNFNKKLQATLPTVMGYLRCGNKRQKVRILLDGGSNTTLVRTGIFPRTESDFFQDHELNVAGGKRIKRKLRILDCQIEDMNGSLSCPLTATEIDKPCGDVSVIRPEHLQPYSHLSEVEIIVAPSPTIDVLLGVDNTQLMVWEQHILGARSDDPVGVKCPLGWFIQGGRPASSASLLNYLNVSAIGSLEEYIGLETAGLEPRRCKCVTDQLDIGATEAMAESITRLPDDSYMIKLPWRKSPDDLPDNFQYAVKRQRCLEKQFSNRPQEWEVYCQQMRDQLKRGVSRHVTSEELQGDRDAGRNMWFLPHFAVVKDSKTTPVRVVYDGKARYEGHALNDYLAKGQNINSNLLDVALRFRENEVGVIADISKMFQAIRIRPEDARFHRFVFRENPTHPMQVYELGTVTFGDKPSPTAAIVTLRHVVREHASDDEELKTVVTDQFYVDDLNESVSNSEEALQLKSKLTETLQKGGFAIRKWQSNVKEVCDKSEDTNVTTALGTRWNLSRDTLSVKDVKSSRDPIPTKRKILAQAASYYDVFGILSGLLVRPKILLQKLWQLDVGWDTPLDERPGLCAMLQSINRDLAETSSIEIPRCLIPEKYRGKRPLPDVSLHGASDASEDAMGIGVWLRWSDPRDDTAQLSFVAARARLTPLKQSSIPRKELQAILLLSRLMLTLKNALRFKLAYSKIWTDSLTAISWLRGQSRSFRSFVAYRVGEITSEFDPHHDVAFVPSELNAIDAVSRGCTAQTMMKVIEGPTYLTQPPESWPQTPQSIPTETADPEKKKFHVRNAKAFALKVDAVTHPTAIVDPTKFSSWSKLKMITARVLSMKTVRKEEWLKKLTEQIAQWPSVGLLREAELYWIRMAQKEINFQDPNIMRLDPFFDEKDKVYRVGGRLRHAPLSYDIRHPYLLPKKGHISLMIVRDRHTHALHGGHLRTATEVRRKYWIVGDINICKRVIRECVVCRRYKGKPVQQRMSELPDFRVKPCTPPFQTTLVDYLGPVNVKLSRNTTTKGYCAVFTCAVTRAIHLTCVPDLSTQSFLQALERFISVRGAPRLLISDNATCFRGADNTVNELNLKFDQSKLKEHGQPYNVDWRFGPPGGPHHQGAVERMVQEVKKAMRHLVKADRLTFSEWETVFTQISGLINSRPLTAKSSSPLDEPPLTPNHFLIGRGDLPCPDVPCEEYKGNPRKRRELCNCIVDGFWKRWMQCIHTLSARKKWQKSTENLEKSDVVLVIGEDRRRGSWKMAEVVNTYPGEDNFVRVVDVRFADRSVARRPVTKLILLMKKEERIDTQ